MAATQAASAAARHSSPERQHNGEPKIAVEVTSSADTSPSSKGDAKGEDVREGPVRRQLKETSIGEQPTQDMANDTDGSASLRGRTSRKRSVESMHENGDAAEDKEAKAGRHVRKRSRDATEDAGTDAGLGEADAKRQSLEGNRGRETTPPASELSSSKAEEVITSPQQGKRSRGDDAERENGESDSRAVKKRPQSPEKKAAPVPTGSGFANFSSQSPFASLSGNKSPLATLGGDAAKADIKQAASSSFASMASSSTSPFASLGASKSAEAKKDANGSGKPSGFSALAKSTASPFASAPSSSFGSATSFGGSLGAGFGSASAFGPPLSGGRLKSFASPETESKTDPAAKPAKAFGAPPADDDDEDEEDGSDSGDTKDEAVVGEASDQVDDRFHEQETETGEESEATIFSARAKLFILDGAWKERGVGVFKLNVRLEDRAVGRFVMRADGSHRVVLNSPVKRGVVDAGKPPTDQSFRFLGINADGSPQLYNLRVRNKEMTVALFEKVLDLQSLTP